MTTPMTSLDRELDEMSQRILDDEERRAARSLQPLAPQLVDAPSQDDRNWAMGLHVATLTASIASGGLLEILIPLVGYLATSERSPWLRNQIKGQLNFQLTFALVVVLGVVASVVTLGLGAVLAVPVVLGMFVCGLVCSTIAAIKASRGEAYRLPLAIPFVK